MPNVTTRRHVRCVGDLPRLLLGSDWTVGWGGTDRDGDGAQSVCASHTNVVPASDDCTVFGAPSLRS
jgi:hypothetical protein